MSRHRDRNYAVFVLAAGLTSLLLYGVGLWAQRALFLNGLEVRAEDFAFRGEPADRVQMRLQFAIYTGATVAVFAIYVGILMAAKSGSLRSRRALVLAVVVFPLLFHAFLLGARPSFSIDLMSYVAHGSIAADLDGSPYLQPTSDALATPVGEELVTSFGWEPVHPVTPYGPLWTNAEVLATRVTNEASGALLVLKLIVAGASLASGCLIWWILGHVRPGAQTLGTIAYMWNPMILNELAGEGHNDAVMVVLVLVALGLLVGGRLVGSTVATTLAVLTKYLPVVFLPAQLVYVWRTRRSGRRLALELAAGTVLSAATVIAIYSPVWAGAATFDGVREASERTFIASTSGTVFFALSHVLSDAQAARATSLLLGGAFAAYVVVRSIQVRDAGGLLSASAAIALAYVLVASPSFWPWYHVLPVALLALTPTSASLALIITLSLGSRLVAPLEVVRENGFISWSLEVWTTTTLAIFVPLALVLAVLKPWRPRRGVVRQRPA